MLAAGSFNTLLTCKFRFTIHTQWIRFPIFTARDILIALEHIVGRYMNQSTIYLLHCLSQVTCSSIVQQISQIEISLCLIYIGISSAVNNYLNIVFFHLFADCVKVSDIQFLIAFSNISEDKLVITLFGANLHFMAQLTISACY